MIRSGAGRSSLHQAQRAGAVNALTSAQLAMAGITSAIPVDEVIDAMRRIGNEMPSAIKETSLGGLATSPTAVRLTEK